MSTVTRLGSTSVNPNSTGGAHTKSTEKVVTASAAMDYEGFKVTVYTYTSNGAAFLLDVYINNVAVVTNMFGNIGATSLQEFVFDIPINTGDEVSFYVQYANVSSSTVTFVFYGFAGNSYKIVGITSYAALNANTAATAPTTTLPGNTTTANTEGVWTEIVASTSDDIVELIVIPQTENATYTGQYLVDIGTGAAASEVEIISNVPARRISGNTVNYIPHRFRVDVPAGTRISARVQADTATVTVRDLPVMIVAGYGSISSGGSGVILYGGFMQRAMKDAETTASKKRGFFMILDDSTGAAWSGSVAGLKAKLSLSGAAEANSTNDIVSVGGGVFYLELTNTEAAAGAAGDIYVGYVPATSGRRVSTPFFIEVTGDDVYAAGLTKEQIAIEVMITQLMGRGHTMAEDDVNDEFVIYDTDGTTELCRIPYTLRSSTRNPVETLGPGV